MTESSNTHPTSGDKESDILIGSDLAGTSLQDAFKKNFDAGNSSEHKKTSDLGFTDANAFHDGFKRRSILPRHLNDG